MRISLVGLLALVAAAPAGAQTWRTMEVSRQLRDSAEQRVRVQYGAGRFDLRPTTTPVLYAMQLRYDEDNGEPVHRYDADRHALDIGVSHQSLHLGRHISARNGGDMRLALSRAVPLDLDVELGAADATLELGGLALRNVRLESGATDATVRFSTPNPAPLRLLSIEVGAGSFTAENLANANTGEIRVQGGVGGVDLDFGGTWTQNVDLDVDVALGKVAVHVPSDVGVRVVVDRFLASFDHEGLSRRGDAWVSDNFDRAAHKLRVRISTAFGGIRVDRDSP